MKISNFYHAVCCSRVFWIFVFHRMKSMYEHENAFNLDRNPTFENFCKDKKLKISDIVFKLLIYKVSKFDLINPCASMTILLYLQKFSFRISQIKNVNREIFYDFVSIILLHMAQNYFFNTLPAPTQRYNYSNFIFYLTFFDFLIIWRASNKMWLQHKTSTTVAVREWENDQICNCSAIQACEMRLKQGCEIYFPFSLRCNRIFCDHPSDNSFCTLRVFIFCFIECKCDYYLFPATSSYSYWR